MGIIKTLKRENGPVALIDGDGIIFRQMSSKDALNKDWYDLREDVDDKFHSILDKLGTDRFRIYLTSRTSFRKELYPSYKANRKKVVIPYLSDMYKYTIDQWDAYTMDKLEADDCVSIDALDLRKKKIPYVVVSIDSDLDQIPGRHLNPYYRQHKVQLYDVSGRQAQYNFCSQMILNRSKDGLSGIKGYGPKSLSKIISLGDVDNLQHVYNKYLEVYGQETGKAEYKKHYTLIRLMKTPPDGYELYDNV